jgi:hypothetical protein
MCWFSRDILVEFIKFRTTVNLAYTGCIVGRISLQPAPRARRRNLQSGCCKRRDGKRSSLMSRLDRSGRSRYGSGRTTIRNSATLAPCGLIIRIATLLPQRYFGQRPLLKVRLRRIGVGDLSWDRK